MPTIKQALESGVKFTEGDCLEKICTSAIELIHNKFLSNVINTNSDLIKSCRKIKVFCWRERSTTRQQKKVTFWLQLRFQNGDITHPLAIGVVDWLNEYTDPKNPMTHWRPAMLTWSEEEVVDSEMTITREEAVLLKTLLKEQPSIVKLQLQNLIDGLENVTTGFDIDSLCKLKPSTREEVLLTTKIKY